MRKISKIALVIMLTATLALGGFFTTAPASAAAKAPAVKVVTADTVYTNGNILTVDAKFTKVKALAVKGSKIVYTGTEKGAGAYIGAKTKVIDLKGKTVIPGLNDSHLHLLMMGEALDRIDTFWKPKAEIIAAVKAEAEKLGAGKWIQSMGWLDTVWTGADKDVFPTKEDLDPVSPNNPVALSRADGHSTWYNSKALEMAGLLNITRADIATGGSIKVPEGGEIIFGADGHPSGMMIDTAAGLVNKFIVSDTSAERTKQRIELADANLASFGITSYSDAGTSWATGKLFKELYQAGKLKTRAYELLSLDGGYLPYLAEGNKPTKDVFGDGKLAFNAVKITSDGSLGSRSAAMIAPYTDAPNAPAPWGLLRFNQAELNTHVKDVTDKGFQLGVHAIGDDANRQAIAAFVNAVGGDKSKVKAKRFRIEHFQIVDPNDFMDAVLMGIIPSMQTVHATSDMNMAETRVGPERIKTSYAWRTVLNLGGIIANGTDAPVEKVNPYECLYAAVTRQSTADGTPVGGWKPEQKLTREEALRSYTIWAAYGQFGETVKGSLEVGKYADFVVLDKDYMTCPENDIKNIKALQTVIGGKVAYTAEGYSEVAKKLSKDAQLKSLKAKVGKMTPKFAKAKTKYTVSLTKKQAATTLTVAPNFKNAKSVQVKIGKGKYKTVKATTKTKVSVKAGKSVKVLVKVTAQNGKTTKTYTITVKRAK
jgi:predicted amidohydrolase YtcJ